MSVEITQRLQLSRSSLVSVYVSMSNSMVSIHPAVLFICSCPGSLSEVWPSLHHGGHRQRKHQRTGQTNTRKNTFTPVGTSQFPVHLSCMSVHRPSESGSSRQETHRNAVRTWEKKKKKTTQNSSFHRHKSFSTQPKDTFSAPHLTRLKLFQVADMMEHIVYAPLWIFEWHISSTWKKMPRLSRFVLYWKEKLHLS